MYLTIFNDARGLWRCCGREKVRILAGKIDDIPHVSFGVVSQHPKQIKGTVTSAESGIQRRGGFKDQ